MVSDFRVAWQLSQREQLFFLLRVKLHARPHQSFFSSTFWLNFVVVGQLIVRRKLVAKELSLIFAIAKA
jgi:hypothetical protein